MSKVIASVNSPVGQVKLIGIDQNPCAWSDLPDFVLLGHNQESGRQEKIYIAVESDLEAHNKYSDQIVRKNLTVAVNTLLETYRSAGGFHLELDEEGLGLGLFLGRPRAASRSSSTNFLNVHKNTMFDVVNTLTADHSILIQGKASHPEGVRMELTLDHYIHVVSHSRPKALRDTHEGAVHGSMEVGTTRMFFNAWHADYSVQCLVRPEDLRIEIAKKLADEFPFLGASSTDLLSGVKFHD